jgi:hypothetical protein
MNDINPIVIPRHWNTFDSVENNIFNASSIAVLWLLHVTPKQSKSGIFHLYTSKAEKVAQVAQVAGAYTA